METVWWGEREYSVEYGIRNNVVMLWLRIGLNLIRLDSVGLRKDRGCERWIGV